MGRSKKVKEGSDIGNGASFEQTNQDDEQDYSFVFTGTRDLVAILRDKLGLEGYHLMPAVGGHYCGYSVYFKSKLEISHLIQPEDFYYYRQLSPDQPGACAKFLRLVKSICEAEATVEESKMVKKMWLEVYQDFSDRATNLRTAVAGVALADLNSVKRITTLTGRAGYHRVVPQKEWFPARLRGLDARELLTLIPDAEARTFMLVLGRILVGAKQTVTAEGTIDHTARSYVILVGSEAGMGKSTLMGYIRETLVLLGYTVTTVNSNMGKFGWGGVAESDLAYIDDLTEDVQRNLMTNNNIKSIVSNDSLKVEEKGMPAVQVRSVTTMIGCTNSSNYSHYIGMDTGSLSRLNQLDTYNRYELSQKYGVSPKSDEYLIKPFWEATAVKYGVTQQTLAAWLLTNCVDLFLESTGYTVSGNGLLTKNNDLDQLYPMMEANRAEYRIDTSLRHAEELPDVLANLVALSIAREAKAVTREAMLNNLQYIDFGPEMLLSIIELFTQTPARVNEFVECYPKHISMSCKKSLKDKMTDLKRLSATQAIERQFTTLIGELKSTKSFGYPSRSAHYQAQWETRKRSIPMLVAEYMVQLESADLPTTLDAVLGDISKTIKGIDK